MVICLRIGTNTPTKTMDLMEPRAEGSHTRLVYRVSPLPQPRRHIALNPLLRPWAALYLTRIFHLHLLSPLPSPHLQTWRELFEANRMQVTRFTTRFLHSSHIRRLLHLSICRTRNSSVGDNIFK